jgi:hypothetical protein
VGAFKLCQNSVDNRYQVTKYDYIIACAITLQLVVFLFRLNFFVLNVYSWIVFDSLVFMPILCKNQS